MILEKLHCKNATAVMIAAGLCAAIAAMPHYAGATTRKISGTYTLAADEDWTGDGTVLLERDSVLDLAGHSLAMSGFALSHELSVTNDEGVVAGYSDLEYLDTTKQGLFTGYRPVQGDIVETKVVFRTVSNNQFIWCDRSTTSSADRFTGGCVGQLFRFGLGGNDLSVTTVATNTIYTIVANSSNGKLIVNGAEIGTVDNYSASFTTPTNLALFTSFTISGGKATLGGNYFTGRFYYMKIYASDGTTLKCDFRPAYDKANDVIGIYDRIAGKFYSNQSSSGEDFTSYKDGADPLITNSAGGDAAVLRLTVPPVASGFRELQYLKTDGGQRITTGYIPNGTDIVETKVSHSSTVNQFIWCSRSTTTSNDRFTGGYVGRFRFGRRSEDMPNTSTITIGTVYTIEANYATGVCTVNGNAQGTFSDMSSFDPPAKLVLFSSCAIKNGAIGSWGNPTYCKCYYFRLKDSSGKLKLDMVPVLKVDTNVCGMYDRVSGTFYQSAGARAFIAGPAVSSSGSMGVLDNTDVAITGNLKIVKDGAGEFCATKTGQSYTGGTEVLDGVLSFGNRPDNRILGEASGDVTASSNGVSVGIIDINGKGYAHEHRFILDGGIMRNTGAALSSALCQVANVYLVNDSTFRTAGYWGMIGKDYGRTILDLGGHTLSVDIGSGRFFFLSNTEIKNGLFDLKSGGHLQTGMESPVGSSNSEIIATNADFRVAVALRLFAPISVRNYEAVYGADYNYCDGEMKVYGTFKPANHNYFRGVTMQDGSMVDLSLREAALPLVSAFTSGDNTLKFADDATVHVKLGGKRFTDDKVISWTSKPANIGTVKFKSAKGEWCAFVAQDDGLYISRGLMIIVK